MNMSSEMQGTVGGSSDSTGDGCGETMAGTTRHAPDSILSITEEGSPLDDTSTTLHEPVEEISLSQSDDKSSVDKLEQAALLQAAAAAASRAREGTGGAKKYNERLHRKVAELAALSYDAASKNSSVLSRSKLADIALVRLDEIDIGDFLGKGSFSDVHEITRIHCAAAPGLDDVDEEEEDIETKGEDTPRNSAYRSNETLVARPTVVASMESGGFDQQNALEMNHARGLLTQHHRRSESGTCRYAIKFLKECVRDSPKRYAVGTADLVLEGMFLASLSHPNIVRVRGLPEGGVKCLYHERGNVRGYFLVLDRLFDTLSARVYGEWAESHQMTVRKRYGYFKDKGEKRERNIDLAVRLKVAFDVSAALKYLHSKMILYRDLKPENLGFDVRGDIKLFDLGLVKELNPDEQDSKGNYRLSMAGTPRYMAPEVGMYKPYNLSADVYSLSMLLWEMVTLTKPLKDYNYKRLQAEIFLGAERPCLASVFNKRIRNLIDRGWSQNPRNRPSMDEMHDKLKAECLRLDPEKFTEHGMSTRKRRSTHIINTHLSVRHLLRLPTELD